MLVRSLALTATIAVTVAITVLAVRPSFKGTRAGHLDADYVKSKSCLACHTDHFASWSRTFHSRMTQEARPESIQGDFDRNNSYEYLGVRARMERRGDRQRQRALGTGPILMEGRSLTQLIVRSGRGELSST